MPPRNAVPLYKTRHAAFIEGAQEIDRPVKSVSGLLGIGTGGRPDTICHTYKDWFEYEGDSLYYVIPGSDLCRKGGNTDPCGDCNNLGHEEYEPKTPAGEGRRILLTNHWHNPVTGEEEYLGLRDAVESYFALDGPYAPDDVQHGHDMLYCDGSAGVSKGTYSTWMRDIGARSSMRAGRRRTTLVNQLNIEDVDPNDDDKRDLEQIKDRGTDADGNGIPDIFGHDMRASYITQLMRNDVSPTKAINKTGHTDPDSMWPYVKFAKGEIDADEEETYY
jgi:hypothetical protein